MSTRIAPWFLALGLVAVARTAGADNTTVGTAYWLAVGGPPAEATVSPTGPVDRWYKTGYIMPGRSYCVQTQRGACFDTSPAGGVSVELYESDGVSMWAFPKTDMAPFTSEPPAGPLGRLCFKQAHGVLVVFIKVSGSGNVRVQVVETTLFSNWFFLGGDYNAFTMLRNTTGDPLPYTVTWRSAAGASVATQSGTLPGNGGTIINARTLPGALAAMSGTVDIVHSGLPGAMVATTTVISATTGLGFDTVFAPRPTW